MRLSPTFSRPREKEGEGAQVREVGKMSVLAPPGAIVKVDMCGW